jgi:demethylmenaquinone methyltransferase/2-methoxy-6-polyprenyl-1,4-benzoquinol methylase
MAPGRPARGSGDLPIDRDPDRIEAMFGGIAPRYDLMNRIMTVGLDGRWRRMAAQQADLARGGPALDVCCGTGDLTFSLVDACPECDVTGLDFTPAMIGRARQKAAARERRGLPSPRRFVAGDLLALPFADAEFAAVTVGWGVRNVPDVPRAFREMARVTRPGGRVVCLESTQPPTGAGRRFHDVWMGRVVPVLGRLVTGDPSAYAYLPASVAAFPRADELAAIMAGAGLTRVRYRRLGLGAVALHVGVVAA